MAVYTYRCSNCGNEEEVTHGMTENPGVICEGCGGGMHRVPQVSAVIYKDGGRFMPKGGLYRSKSKEPDS